MGGVDGRKTVVGVHCMSKKLKNNAKPTCLWDEFKIYLMDFVSLHYKCKINIKITIIPTELSGKEN